MTARERAEELLDWLVVAGADVGIERPSVVAQIERALVARIERAIDAALREQEVELWDKWTRERDLRDRRDHIGEHRV